MTNAFQPHNHSQCSAHALTQAASLCAKQGVRLTPVRQRTLEILLEDHRAMGAYEVLDRLIADGFGKQPPVAYRALEFLVDLGLVHRINRLNAFAACAHAGEAHAPTFLICQTCHSIAEIPAPRLQDAINATAAESGFRVEFASVEAIGLCPKCQHTAGSGITA